MDEGCNSIVTEGHTDHFICLQTEAHFCCLTISLRMLIKMKVEKRLTCSRNCYVPLQVLSLRSNLHQTHRLQTKKAAAFISRMRRKTCYHRRAVSFLLVVSYTSVVKGTIMWFLTTHICSQCQVTCSCSLSLTETQSKGESLN